MDIISGKDASNQALSLISKKYRFFKVLILTPQGGNNAIGSLIEQIIKSVKCAYVLKIPKGAREMGVLKTLIGAQLTDDVGLIVNFCDEAVLNAANEVCGKIKILSFLTEPNLNIVLSNSNFLVIDNNLISNATCKSVANCYGLVCACSFYLMEQVFNRAVFGVNYNAQNLLEVENILQSLVLIPAALLKHGMGKLMLTNICVKLRKYISLTDYNNSYVNTLANSILDVSKYKTLTNGEALIISSVLCFKMFKVLVNSLSLSSQIGFNSYMRIKNHKNLNKNFSFSGVTKSFFCNENLNEYINNFFKIKTSFAVVFNTYENMFNKLLNIFKGLYLDRGICLNKFLIESNLIAAVNAIPEQFSHPCFATFLRDVGLLNKFDV